MRDVLANPQRLRRIPFQFSRCCRVRKVSQCVVYSAKQLSQTMKQLGAVGPDVREQCSGQKAQQPDKVLLSIHQSHFSECLTLQVQLDPWQHNSGGAIGQVLQSLTLQVKEGAFSARVHDFQDECSPIRCLNVEIV